MAELREQMKSKSTRLQSEYKDLSHGIHSSADEAKLRAMESKHKTVLGTASSAFSKAEDEKKRWKEQHESEVERKHKDNLERARLRAAEDEKRKLAVNDKIFKIWFCEEIIIKRILNTSLSIAFILFLATTTTTAAGRTQAHC